MQYITAMSAGAGFSFSLIAAIGAQNAFVLKQGLQRRHVLPVVVICALSDVLLIALGVTGAAIVLTERPGVLAVLRAGGATFLLVYAAVSTRRAFHPRALYADAAVATSLVSVVVTCLAITWLNPHVYLDTVVLLGSIANTYGENREWFAIGAALTSVIWFVALGYGARLLRPVFAKPGAWRVLDGLIAFVMCGLGVSLLIGP